MDTNEHNQWVVMPEYFNLVVDVPISFPSLSFAQDESGILCWLYC
jgi:hypothetical protein